MLAIALALVPASSTLAAGPDLFEKPFRWRDARGIVDLEKGRAAPCLVDLDADGVCDLVVGASAEGRVLWYRNAGTQKAPRFVDPGWVQLSQEQEQEQEQARARSLDGGPCFADIDADGMPDLLSCVDGELLLSRGLGQRSFAPSVKLCDRRGGVIRIPCVGSFAVADWNGDGNPDLVVIDETGKLRVRPILLRSGAAPAFGTATLLELGESEPVPKLGPTPMVVDWDGDGLLDLLVGSSEGSVVFYKGYVDQGVHLVQPGEVLLQPCYADQPATLAKNEKTGLLEPQLTRSHRCARPAVCDWNGDGRLDLVVGDLFVAMEPEPQLSKEQTARRDELRTQSEEVRKQLTVTRKEIDERVGQDLRKLGLDPASEASRDVREALLRSRKTEDVHHPTLTQRLEELTQELEPLTARQQIHGYVWVYLRRGAALASAK